MILPVGLQCLLSLPVKGGNACLYCIILSVIYWFSQLLFFIISTFLRKTIFGIGFLPFTVFLVLQFLPVGDAVMADRYSYVPSIGLFYLAGEGFYWLWSRSEIKHRVPFIDRPHYHSNSFFRLKPMQDVRYGGMAWALEWCQLSLPVHTFGV